MIYNKKSEVMMKEKKKSKAKIIDNQDNTSKNKKKKITEISKLALKKAIKKHEGNITEVAESFGYEKNSRHTIYKRIAQFGLIEELKLVRNSDDFIKDMIGFIAKEKLLELLSNIETDKPSQLTKSEGLILIFALKTCAGFVEATEKSQQEINNTADEPLDRLATVLEDSAEEFKDDLQEESIDQELELNSD
jgi:hypothetical protein